MLYLTEAEIDCDLVSKQSPQDYVNKVMKEADLTHRDVAARAQALGHKLSAGYVHNIASGQVSNPSIQLTQALAAGLGRPEDEVFLVFRGKPLQEEGNFTTGLWAVAANEYKKLPAADQKELKPTIQMLLHEIQRRLTKS
jgi:transcriptional regulator with XRE-family HTH domain